MNRLTNGIGQPSRWNPVGDVLNLKADLFSNEVFKELR